MQKNILKIKIILSIHILIAFCALEICPVYGDENIIRVSKIEEDAAIKYKQEKKEKKVQLLDVKNIIKGILKLRNNQTKLCPSHWRSPGYKTLGFLYDQAVIALILKACGYQEEAEEILDYFVRRLDMPTDKLVEYADTNGIYGILKVFKSRSSERKVKSIVNAFDVTSIKPQGRAELEFWTTPGPLSFLIFAMLNVNSEKYKYASVKIGNVLIAMQKEDGGIQDGDRAPEKVHTEPHVDAFSAFSMLYEITNNKKWQVAGQKGYDWFSRNVLHIEDGIIDQGIWTGWSSTIFATDCYSWTMAGPTGDMIPLDVIKKITKTMLNKSLVRIKIALPDKSIKTAILCDFSDPEDYRVQSVRNGFHPMGSIEWTGGAILALQKNAVRCIDVNDYETAKYFKAIAEVLMEETAKCFYTVNNNDSEAKYTFYATSQDIQIAPFGSIESDKDDGWKTPSYFVRNKQGESLVEGGSPVGAWPILPYLGLNPFILNDDYKENYDKIDIEQRDKDNARKVLEKIVAGRFFVETVPLGVFDEKVQIVEPMVFNKKMWTAIEAGSFEKRLGNEDKAKYHFEEAIRWAERVTNNLTWVKLAKRDNIQKQKDFGGLPFYPWGDTYPNNDHPLHVAIWKYPLLNEVGVAMWGLATANYELGNNERAKYWIRRIIEEVPLHQIADTITETNGGKSNIIQGYWNAIISWEFNPARSVRDKEMGYIYREVIQEKDLSFTKPRYVFPADKQLSDKSS